MTDLPHFPKLRPLEELREALSLECPYPAYRVQMLGERIVALADFLKGRPAEDARRLLVLLVDFERTDRT